MSQFRVSILLGSEHLLLLYLLLGVQVCLYRAVLHLWVELEGTAGLQAELIQAPVGEVPLHDHDAGCKVVMMTGGNIDLTVYSLSCLGCGTRLTCTSPPHTGSSLAGRDVM